MSVDSNGRNHPEVGTGAPSFWVRPTNRYAGCCCPAWRYSPRHPKPTNPECHEHGESRQDQAA